MAETKPRIPKKKAEGRGGLAEEKGKGKTSSNGFQNLKSQMQPRSKRGESDPKTQNPAKEDAKEKVEESEDVKKKYPKKNQNPKSQRNRINRIKNQRKSL